MSIETANMPTLSHESKTEKDEKKQLAEEVPSTTNSVGLWEGCFATRRRTSTTNTTTAGEVGGGHAWQEEDPAALGGAEAPVRLFQYVQLVPPLIS